MSWRHCSCGQELATPSTRELLTDSIECAHCGEGQYISDEEKWELVIETITELEERIDRLEEHNF